jgi:hypothetical protein
MTAARLVEEAETPEKKTEKCAKLSNSYKVTLGRTVRR